MYGAQSSAKPVLDMGGQWLATNGLNESLIKFSPFTDNAAENSFCRFFENMPPVCAVQMPVGTEEAHSDFVASAWYRTIVRSRSKPFPRLPICRPLSKFRQDYFSAHGQDALMIASQVYKTTNVIKYLGGGGASKSPSSSASNVNGITSKGLPSLTLSMALAKGFLRDALTTRQMRVEIWESAGGMQRNASKWQLGKEVCAALRASGCVVLIGVYRPRRGTFSSSTTSCSAI